MKSSHGERRRGAEVSRPFPAAEPSEGRRIRRGEDAGRNDTRLRPGYLRKSVAAVEGYGSLLNGLTTANRQNRIVDVPTARPAALRSGVVDQGLTVVEQRGIEPLTSAVRLLRSPI